MAERKCRVKPGDIFTRLTVIKELPQEKTYQYRWLCECQCGKKKAVIETYLLKGQTKSCGCLLKDTIQKQSKIRWQNRKGKTNE